MVDPVLEKEIQNLIDQKLGDSERLKFILESIKNNKKVYNSDQKYLINLLTTHSKDEDILERLDFLNPEKKESVTTFADNAEEESQITVQTDKPQKKGRSKKKKLGIGVGIFVILFFVIGIADAIVNPMTPEERAAYDEIKVIENTGETIPSEESTSKGDDILHDWDYEDILRNESSYKNKIFSIKGIVLNYVQYDDLTFGLGICHNSFSNISYDCDQLFWVYHDGSRVLEDDVVEVTGVFMKISELKTPLGVTSYHPSLDSQTLVLVPVN